MSNCFFDLFYLDTLETKKKKDIPEEQTLFNWSGLGSKIQPNQKILFLENMTRNEPKTSSN